jgi:4-diphosphocytidyl-2-C-methyl-D-erythritol kinase
MPDEPAPPTDPADATILLAPAKLTLSLRVTGVRADGYHLIDAEMVTLDLCDELDLRPTAGPSRLAIDAGPSRPAAAGVAADADNLVLRALAAVDRRAQVRLVKRIPPGAGLGGGSADAAAVLRWAGCTDLAVAARLGADVPFCVVGGRARVRGIGEIVDPLPARDQVLTLLTPPFGCSTPVVYAAWDALGGPTAEAGLRGPNADAGLRGPNADAGLRGPNAGAGANDLEPAALVVEPRLAGYRDRLGEATGQVPRLAGSGSTWFVEGAFPGPGRIVARTAPAPPSP